MWQERARLSVVCLVAVLGYWLAYNYTSYNSPQGMEYFTNKYQIVVDEIDPNNLPSAVATETPFEDIIGRYSWTSCSGPCYNMARFTLNLDARQDAAGVALDWGFVPSYNTDNFKVLLNGVTVMQLGEFSDTPSFHGKRSWLVRLPNQLLKKAGPNYIDVILVRYVDTAKVAGAFIGPYKELDHALASRFFFFYELPKINAIVALTLAGLVLVAVPMSSQRGVLLWFVVLTASWAMLAIYRLWFTIPADDVLRAAYYFSVTNLVYLSLFGFFVYWSAQTYKKLVWIMLGLYLLIHGIYHGLGDLMTVNDKEALLSDQYQLIVVVTLLYCAVRHYFVATEARYIESAAIFVAISSAALDTLAQVSGVFDFYSLSRTLPVFIVAVVASMFYRRVRLFETEQSKNAFLAEALEQAQAELELQHHREREQERGRILGGERLRILQDMHDGVGGRLAALLERQRSLPGADPSVTVELQQSLQDLVLIIDSLDEELNQDLGSALGVLRNRLSPALEAAGLRVSWQMNIEQGCALGPERTLHLYRCIQEAIHNVIRHANARELMIVVHQTDSHLEVVVADDGKGMNHAAPGRGFSNLKKRMQSLQGEFAVESQKIGTRITFTFPI